MTETLVACTSLSPDMRRYWRQKTCIASWRKAGLTIVSFNHPSEVQSLRRHYDIEFVPVAETSANIFGRPYIPINAMLDWIGTRGHCALLINSDIELKATREELLRIRWLSEGGLCYFVRYNQDAVSGKTWLEPAGIDAFLLDARDVGLLGRCFLSMGQPYWDYWMPYTFATAGRRVCAVEFPLAFHLCHPQRWSTHNWHRCALEFARVTGQQQADTSHSACAAISLRVRAQIESVKVSLPAQPVEIRHWVQTRFADPSPKVFLELGAHDGSDTRWLAELPNVTLHAFEPDPRNTQLPRDNVVMHRAAVGDFEGVSPFIPSDTGWGRTWTHSSSIKRPKNHLARYPVTFGDPITVPITTLDGFRREWGVDQVDFIWADIQGAEGEMIRGGRETLQRTRFLYTEYSNEELYENQVSLREILALLPEFRIAEVWADDVLLENRAF